MANVSTVSLILTREQVREVDRRALAEFKLLGLVLMENAGRNAAELLRSLGITGRVVICCGKGNNGGDGFVMARHLENAGVDVRVLLSVPPASLTGDAETNFQVLQQAKTPLLVPPIDWPSELGKADWIVDALLGTGTQGAIRNRSSR
jgi:NAD(P)H-hydrate epimerase